MSALYPTITISSSVHILKALNGAAGPVQRFRGLHELLKNPFNPAPHPSPNQKWGGFLSKLYLFFSPPFLWGGGGGSGDWVFQ